MSKEKPWEDDAMVPWAGDRLIGTKPPPPQEPSRFDKRVARFGETMDDPRATAPEKALALAGQSAGYLGDIASIPAEYAMKGVAAVTPDFIKQGLESVFGKIMNAAKSPEVTGTVEALIKTAYPRTTKFVTSPRVQRDIGNVANLVALYPAAKGTAAAIEKVGKPVATAVGEKSVIGGKKWLQSQMKMKESSARRAYGKSLMDKKNQITNDIVEFGLHQSKDFDDMSKRSLGMVKNLQERSEALAKQVEADQIKTATAKAKAAQSVKFNQKVAMMEKGDPRIEVERAKILAENLPASPKNMSNPVAMVKNSVDDLAKEVPYGDVKKVRKIADGIMEEMTEDGLNKPVTITRLIEAKRRLVGDGKMFKLGPTPSKDDIVDALVRKEIAYRYLDKVGKLSPELREIGKQQKRLMDIALVSDDAAVRMANRDPLGLGAKIVLGTSALGASGAAFVGQPQAAAATLASGIGQYALERAVREGAGPRKMIKAGLAIQKAGKPSRVRTLGNLKGL